MLRQALETLCAGISFPHIALSFDGERNIQSPALAHAIFCIVREAISDMARQSGAAALQIALSVADDGMTITIREDGDRLRKTARQ